MDNENMLGYLASIDVIKKGTDTEVKDIIKKLIKPETRKDKEDDIKSHIEASKAFNKKEIDIDYPDLLKKSMIINNKVAVKGISLPEQKIITTSNYSQEILDKTILDIKREVLKTSDVIMGDLKDFSIIKGYNQGKSIIDNIKKKANEFGNSLPGKLSGLSDNNKDKKDEQSSDENKNNVNDNGVVQDWVTDLQKQEIVVLSGIKSTKGTDMSTEAIDWLHNIIDTDSSNGNTFRYNFTVYKNGTSIRMTPMFGKLNPVALSKVSISYVSKMSRKKRIGKAGFEYINKSYFQEKELDFKVSENLALKVSANSSESSKNRLRQKNNPFIRDMLLAGPDLFSNMFDVYLRFNNFPTNPDLTLNVENSLSDPTSYVYFIPILEVSQKGKSKLKQSYALESTFNDVYSISVRTASVDIPLIKRGITDIPFLNTKITRPNGLVEYDLQGTLSIDCDANTYVNDMFLALAGLQRDGKFRNGKSTTFKPINEGMYDHVSHFPFMAPAKTGFQMTSVDIVVSSHGLGAYHDKSVNPGGGGFFSNILYVLKDVRFLGSSDIKFSTESDSSQTIEAGFVARRIETYYKPDNLPYAITQGVGASSIFDGRNRNGLAYDEVSINEDSEQE